jgi:hypothetical protein
MAVLFCVLSVLLAVSFFDRARGGYWKAALGGVAYASAVLAFPYVILSLPVFVAFWWIRVKKDRPGKRAVFGAAWFLGGCAAVALLLGALAFPERPYRK